MKEYIKEILCILGLHQYGKPFNASRFYDSGIGFHFGWIARWGKECTYCEKKVEWTPFLKSKRKSMIEEALALRKK